MKSKIVKAWVKITSSKCMMVALSASAIVGISYCEHERVKTIIETRENDAYKKGCDDTTEMYEPVLEGMWNDIKNLNSRLLQYGDKKSSAWMNNQKENLKKQHSINCDEDKFMIG